MCEPQLKCSKKKSFYIALMNTQSNKYACTKYKKHHLIDPLLKDLNIMIRQKLQNLYHCNNYTYPRQFSAGNSNNQLGIKSTRTTTCSKKPQEHLEIWYWDNLLVKGRYRQTERLVSTALSST
jgi:hypothetical protein